MGRGIDREPFIHRPGVELSGIQDEHGKLVADVETYRRPQEIDPMIWGTILRFHIGLDQASCIGIATSSGEVLTKGKDDIRKLKDPENTQRDSDIKTLAGLAASASLVMLIKDRRPIVS